MQIGFIGAGSLGSLFGAYLASIDAPDYPIKVTLIGRAAHMNAVHKNGLLLKNNQGKHRLKNIKAYASVEQIKEKKFDYLFLTTKAYDIKSALEQYKRWVDSCLCLVIMQNGIGNAEIAKNYCNPKKIIRGVTSNGAMLSKPGLIIHTGLGITKIGIPFLTSKDPHNKNTNQARDAIKRLQELLNRSGLKTQVSEDIIKECWEKVFVNIGINPFGALTRLPNGKLLELSNLKALMAKAVDEAVQVAKIKNVNLSDENFVEVMFDVARKTAANKNSMLQDIMHEKKTEIGYMNGKIVSYAKELNLPVPINELLTNLIRGLEKSYRDKSPSLTVIK